MELHVGITRNIGVAHTCTALMHTQGHYLAGLLEGYDVDAVIAEAVTAGVWRGYVRGRASGEQFSRLQIGSVIYEHEGEE